MKYVITGAAGNISKLLAERLLKSGNQVTVIGRNAEHLSALKQQGATVAVGSVEDVDFLKKTFAGADAVYTMVPPHLAATDWKSWIATIGKNYADAIAANNVKYVVNLSSIGAHLEDGCGPVSGLHRAEEEFNKLKNTNVLHLRPSYFFNNLLANVGLAKHMNIIGSNFGGENKKIVLVDPADIAEVAFDALSNLNFKGHTVKYIASDERSGNEIANVLGNAIGKPELPWVVFSDEQAVGGMLQAGLPEEVAKNYAEMGHSLESGKMFEDYWKNHPEKLGKTKLEDFAKTFAAVYSQN